MKSLQTRVIALTVLVLILPFLLADSADAGRRSALAGNLLITDADDTFIFPHEVLQYANMVILDMGGDATTGSGSFLFGSETFGVFLNIHRSDFLSSVTEGFWDGTDRGVFPPMVGLDLGGVTSLRPHEMQWFDLGAAGMVGNLAIGGRLGLGADANKIEDEPAGSPNSETTRSANATRLQGSLGIDEWLDVTIELMFGSSEDSDTTPGFLRDLEGSVSGFSLGGRAFRKIGTQDWGFLVALTTGSTENDRVSGSDVVSDDTSVTMFMLGAGPTWDIDNGDTKIAALLMLGNQSKKFEPGDVSSEETRSFFTFPGATVSAEHRLWPWLWVRAGARGQYVFTSHETDTPTRKMTTTGRMYDFRWTGGVGVEKGRFHFDAAINEPWVNTGPSFLGADSKLFTWASVSLDWE